MFISWRDVLAQEQHFEEIRREADAERLANQCLVQRRRNRAFLLAVAGATGQLAG